jgi:ABC-type uncharacterized transport system substrate-binding protein
MIAIRAIIATLLYFAVVTSAQAHPHVWVTMKTEIVFTSDGKITGVRQEWPYDELFSSFGT